MTIRLLRGFVNRNEAKDLASRCALPPRNAEPQLSMTGGWSCRVHH